MAWTSRSQYEELQELGRGGFGQAKLVRKLVGTGQLFVVKEVNLAKVAESCGEDDAFVDKIIQMTKLEAANMMGLQHENIVRVYGYFEEMHLRVSYYHIVMEYCELGDLNKAIREASKKAPFEEKLIRRWSRQLASALKFLHNNEFVHRDIKPANIFLVAKKESTYLKLGDFGLGKQVDQIAQAKTTMTTVGTEAYCSPEVAQMKPYTKKSDIWALGIVVFELAALKRPFENKPDRPMLHQIIHAPTPKIPENYSKYIQEFINLLLTKDPEERPFMTEIIKHRAIAHSSSSQAFPPTETSPTAKEVPAAAEVSQPLSPDVFKPVSSNDTTTKIRPTSMPVASSSDTTKISKPKSALSTSDSPTVVAKPTAPGATGEPSAAAAKTVRFDLPTVIRKSERNAAETPTTVSKGLPITKIEPKPAPPPKPAVAPLPKPEPFDKPTKVVHVPATTPSKPPRAENVQKVSSSILPPPQAASVNATAYDEDAGETLILRQERSFAIKSTYERPKTAPAAPSNFTLNKVPEVKVDDPQTTTIKAPSSSVLESQLQEYGTRTQVFKNVDRHAVEVGKSQHKSFKDLIWDLIYAQNITDEFEKARALFLWLCTKDLGKMNFTNPVKDSPEEILMHLKNGRANYAHIFKLMCEYSGLQCVLIRGLVKGVNYTLGQRFTDDKCGHTWCAVMIGGQWRFVDANWASRSMIKALSELQYELDEFYFLAPPQQFIYTHFPNETSWQLMPHPISLADFEALPLLTSMFFKLKLELDSSSNQLSLKSDNRGEAVIEISQSKQPALPFEFIYRLNVLGNEQQTSNQHVYHDVDFGQRLARFRIRVPSPSAKYELTLFGLPPEHVGKSTLKSASYSAVGSWLLSGNVAGVGFPLASNSGKWGGPDASELIKRDITKCPSDGRLTTDKRGQVEIAFERKRQAKPITFTAQLFTADSKSKMTPEALKECVLLRPQENGLRYVILVVLPTKGEFGLEVYASVPGEGEHGDRVTMPFLCQYLIEANASSSIRFPPLNGSYLGPKQQFQTLGLKAISNSDPFIQHPDWSLPLELIFECPKPIQSTSKLMFIDRPGIPEEEYVNMTLHQCVISKKHDTFMCRFPRPGMYKLEIFAKLPSNSDSGGGTIPNLFNYLIHVGGQPVKHTSMKPFPKQFSQWCGGHLAEPLDGIVKRHSNNEPKSLKFKLAIQNANKVVAICGDKWTPLELDKGGYWQGTVSLDEAWRNVSIQTLSIVANFASNKPTSFSSLLEYSLKH